MGMANKYIGKTEIAHEYQSFSVRAGYVVEITVSARLCATEDSRITSTTAKAMMPVCKRTCDGFAGWGVWIG